MVTTGYSDTFNRTVSNGLGVATSGQTYTLNSTNTQYSVAPSTATIAPSTSAADRYGYIDLETINVDVTGQVAFTAIPATNLATAGFVAKLSSTSNYYVGSMMVATGGAISVRFSRVVAGGLVTLSTVATGLTYVANTFYNLRYSIYWSRPLQTNVMSLKLWVVGSTEPGGWTATFTDSSFTDYTSGTNVGIHARDESTVAGAVTMKYRSVVSRSYNLPMPATTDPMCFDPGVTYPKQTSLQSLAQAADTAMATIDPLVSLATLFPRVRVSNSLVPVNTAAWSGITYNATEFNVGTTTNLGYDNTSVYLPAGVWLCTFEMQLVEAASNYLTVIFFGGLLIGQPFVTIRSNPVQANDQGVGGCAHVAAMTYSTDPTTPMQFGVNIAWNNLATTYTIKYMALSAIKISDYFA